MSDKSFPNPEAIEIKENSDELKILSWNLWWKFENYIERQELIFQELKSLKPDILCLQEVWEEKDESQANMISQLLDYNYVYGESFEVEGVKFGNAIISKFPIKNHAIHSIPTDPNSYVPGFDEKKVLIHCEIEYKDMILNVMCTHLNYKHEQGEIRENQITFILEYISKLKTYNRLPIILCGDFNAEPDSDEIRLIKGLRKPINEIVLRDAWVITNPDDNGFTWSNTNPYAKKTLEYDRRIDYIFIEKAKWNGLGHPKRSVIVGKNGKNGVFPSDHFGIMTHLVG